MISGGGTPPTQRTNLRFAQIVEDFKNFNFGRPMPPDTPYIPLEKNTY